MLSLLIGPVVSLIDKIIPDADEAQKAKNNLLMLEKQGETDELNAIVTVSKGQMDINKQEAAHKSIFVAGWRPFIGWTCGFGLCWQFVIQPMLLFLLPLLGFYETLPVIDSKHLMELVLGMLGLGAMRTYEKRKSVSREK